jgi:hypothetical protein
MMPSSRTDRTGLYRWLALLLSTVGLSLLAVAVSVVSAQRAVHQERTARLAGEQALCAVLITMDDAYQSAPPSTPTGRSVAEGIAGLRSAYDCDGK